MTATPDKSAKGRARPSGTGSREPSPAVSALTGFDPARLAELADRCEQAGYPLDFDIARSVEHDRYPPRYYTSSLDAAMTLVPDGWFIILDDLGADGLALCTLRTPEGMRKVVGIARNLNLALCAAALRARAAQ